MSINPHLDRQLWKPCCKHCRCRSSRNQGTRIMHKKKNHNGRKLTMAGSTSCTRPTPRTPNTSTSTKTSTSTTGGTGSSRNITHHSAQLTQQPLPQHLISAPTAPTRDWCCCLICTATRTRLQQL